MAPLADRYEILCCRVAGASVAVWQNGTHPGRPLDQLPERWKVMHHEDGVELLALPWSSGRSD
jgi:hypothetical protein